VSAWPRGYIPPQLISLAVITLIGIHALYFIFAWISYKFIFNHEMMKHPRFIKNQVKLEIQTSLRAFPSMMLLTIPWFRAVWAIQNCMTVSIHMAISTSLPLFHCALFLLQFSNATTLIQTVFRPFSFLLVTDYCIYWVHRWLHLPFFYKHLHNHITNGLIRLHYTFPLLWVEALKTHVHPSPHAVFIARLPPCGWLPAINSLSHLHFCIPY
jgi:lathosterol oxidase